MISIEGNIVDATEVRRMRIEIADNGIISKVMEPRGQADVIFKEELIFPGFIDLHVHARECANHAWDYKEDFATAGEAAINGGVVAFAAMPNDPIPPIDDQSYKEKKLLSQKSAAEVVLYAGISPKTQALSFAVPYKVYISKSVGELFFDSYEQLDRGLKNYQGQNISFHCEDPQILKNNLNAKSHELRRPPQAEISAVEFALELIEKYKIAGKICHCSTAESVAKVVAAKNRGVNVTLEVAPHHLYFDESTITEQNKKMFQINPPIRQTESNRLALINALKQGQIDFLATDHSPHTISEKEAGTSGMPHLDTYSNFTTWLMQEHKFTPQEILRVCSANPAKFINQFLSEKYGQIQPGFIGSLTVININNPVKVEKNKLKTKAGWSPFENLIFPGAVIATVIKGKLFKTLWTEN